MSDTDNLLASIRHGVQVMDTTRDMDSLLLAATQVMLQFQELDKTLSDGKDLPSDWKTKRPTSTDILDVSYAQWELEEIDNA